MDDRSNQGTPAPSPPLTEPTALRFGVFELDLKNGQLLRNGRPRRLQPQPLRALSLLAVKHGQTVSREEICRHIWGDGVHVDFDDGLNYCVRQIRNALGDKAENPRFIETLPRRGYRFIAPVEERFDSPPEKTSFGKGLSRWIAAVAAAAAAVVLLLMLWPTRGTSDPDRSMLVVLPFHIEAQSSTTPSFCTGFDELIRTRLARLDPTRLGVIASTSSMRYEHEGKSVSEISSELGVDYLLEGSLRCGQRSVHVTARLIDAVDQSQRWAQIYDEQAPNVFDLQGRLASLITGETARLLLGESRLLPPQAPWQRQEKPVQEAYLKGRYLLLSDQYAKALESLEWTVEHAPRFPEASALLAYAHSQAPFFLGTDTEQSFLAAERHASAALKLRPDLAEARCALALKYLFLDWDWEASETEFLRSIQDNPEEIRSRFWFAALLSYLGRHDEALNMIESVRRLDPVSAAVNADTAWYLFYARRYDEAAQQARLSLRLRDTYWARQCLIRALLFSGRTEQTLEEVKIRSRIYFSDESAFQEFLTSFADQDPDKSLAKYYRLIAQKSRDLFSIAVFQALAGEQPATVLASLQRAAEIRHPSLTTLKVNPVFDRIRSHPQFEALSHRIFQTARSNKSDLLSHSQRSQSSPN